MKMKLTITVEKTEENLEITYKRKDIEKPESVDDQLLLAYIEGLIRYTIDNGFAPTNLPKEQKDGEEVGK